MYVHVIVQFNKSIHLISGDIFNLSVNEKIFIKTYAHLIKRLSNYIK